MHQNITMEMLVFNLKLLGKKSKKNILISAGNESNKMKLLPAIKKLSGLNIHVYATEGTSLFLFKEGVDNCKVYKIVEKKEPNINSFLRADRFDLIINILVGNSDYDETSDSDLIRTLSVRKGIPLITDVDIAIKTIEQMVLKHEEVDFKTKIGMKAEPWNLKIDFYDMVKQLSGLSCHHAHFDKAYLISLENLKLSQVDMQKKWELYKYLKENYTFEDLVSRITRATREMINNGVTYCRTLVDADDAVKLLPVKAALEVKHQLRDEIDLEIGIQPLQGLRDDNCRKYFVQACEMADYIGGLPSKDRPEPDKHIDYIMDLSKELGKKIDVHVDQENNPDENETELLALKTIEHGLEGQVNAVHAISLAAKPENKQNEIIKMVKDAGIGVIICPSAALSMKQLKKQAPLHNSIAPLVKLIDADIPIYLGVDNICDLFMPLADGDIWTECRMLMEACRFYDIETIAHIACKKTKMQVQTTHSYIQQKRSNQVRSVVYH